MNAPDYVDLIRSARVYDVAEKTPLELAKSLSRRLGNRIHGAAVVPPAFLAERTPLPIVVSVAHAEPRARIRRALVEMGYREPVDFVCAA